jgi:hypothetical protein
VSRFAWDPADELLHRGAPLSSVPVVIVLITLAVIVYRVLSVPNRLASRQAPLVAENSNQLPSVGPGQVLADIISFSLARA